MEKKCKKIPIDLYTVLWLLCKQNKITFPNLSSTDSALLRALEQRILIIDGAMGTMIQRHQLEEPDFRLDSWSHITHPLKGNNDVLVLTQPDIIKDIHAQYLDAGADILETNTFSSNRISQADYGLEEMVYDLNVAGARVAREVADAYTALNPDKPRFVAGSIGPTNRTASLSPDVNDPGYRAVNFDTLATIFGEQIEALMDGGVDMLLFETIIDTLNAKAALFAAEEVFERRGQRIPIMVSATITDASGRTLSGQTTEAFLISVSHVPLLSIGLNCALGAKDLRPYLQVLAKEAPCFVSAYPNAGLPNEFGQYDQNPEEMGAEIKLFLEDQLVNILGGCCGTTPEHIKVIADLCATYSPRKLSLSALAQ